MAITQKTSDFSPNELLQAAAELNPAEFDKFVAGAIQLRARRQAANLSTKESELLLKINRGIDSKTQQRFDALVAKRRSETLTPEEHQELLRLTNRIEKVDARRIEMLAELARIRQQTFDETAAELGIGRAQDV